jgi:hypothetical protein
MKAKMMKNKTSLSLLKKEAKRNFFEATNKNKNSLDSYYSESKEFFFEFK